MYTLLFLSGGTGSRMHNATPKQYLLLAGKPVVVLYGDSERYTLTALVISLFAFVELFKHISIITSFTA